ncbi:MAG: hypothetical protein PHG27_02820 [Massilibacteroides sp.]|nr:hypothetical protein [Massilibacteroides sp.]MDD3062548.1 hypothetical protein [Massilibacteroides sp.]MDD4114519.1 hypothetical protein [Massilibacteroides sp.]MDD4659360.1 hypothetical protein [Massilibacteroides sp.]
MQTFNGSLCFNIPFETNKSNLLNREYYKKIKNNINNNEICYEQKKELISFFRTCFPNVCPVMACNQKIKYEGSFLCHCVSVADKFLDDKNHNNFALQFLLGRYPVSYTYESIKGKKCSFSFDLLLTLHSHVEVNDEEIQTHLLLLIPLENRSADEIIFIKHLFFKNKLFCRIGEDNDMLIIDRLKNWLIDLNQIIHDKQINNEWIEKLEISNSLLELYPTINYQDNSISSATEYGYKNAAMIYGLITSDEGWQFINQEEAAKRLQMKWSLRPFECFYFIHSNCLILYYNPTHMMEDYKNSQISIFHKYQYKNTDEHLNQKYKAFCELYPCIPGVRSMFLFIFQDISFRKMKIIKAMDKSDMMLKQSNEKNSIRVKKLRIYQNTLFKEIEKNIFGAPEMINIQSLLLSSFSIPELTARLKEKYNRTIILLENESTDKTNKTIRLLTFITVGIGVLQVSISLLNAKDQWLNYLVNSILILLIVVLLVLLAYYLYLSNKRNFRFIKNIRLAINNLWNKK